MGEANPCRNGAVEADAARGSVLDGLAALQNFENLLRSPRIGPRSLGPIVGEIRSSCAPIESAFSLLLADIASRAPQTEIVEALSESAHRSVLDLDRALLQAGGGDMGAKSRLALEADVRRVSASLGALRNLVEMLDAATRMSVTELDLHALLTAALASLAPRDPSPRSVVQVSVTTPDPPVTLVTDPRVMMALIALCISLAADSGNPSLELFVVFDAPAEALVVRPGKGRGKPVACLPPAVLPPSELVVRDAAARLGARFDFDRATYTCTLGLPSIGVTQITMRSDLGG